MVEIVLSPQPVQKQFLDATERIVFYGGGGGYIESYAATL